MKMGGISVFSCFWPKMSAADRVSKHVVIVDSTVEPKEVGGGDSEEKLEKFVENSLVERLFEFFLFLEGAGECDVTTELILRCCDVGVSVCVPGDE